MDLCVIRNGHICHSSSYGQANEIAISLGRNITMIHNYIICRSILSTFYIIYFLTHFLMLSLTYFMFIHIGNAADIRMGNASLPGL